MCKENRCDQYEPRAEREQKRQWAHGGHYNPRARARAGIDWARNSTSQHDDWYSTRTTQQWYGWEDRTSWPSQPWRQ